MMVQGQSEIRGSVEESLSKQLSNFLTLSAIILRTHNPNVLIELINKAVYNLVPAVTYSFCYAPDSRTPFLKSNTGVRPLPTLLLPPKIDFDEAAWTEAVNSVSLTLEVKAEIGVNYLYALPIHNPTRRFGTLLVGGSGELSPMDLRFLVSLADLAAIALDNADHFDLLEQAVKENLIVNEVARALASSLNPEELFGVFLQQLKLYLTFDKASLILIDHDPRFLRLLFNWNPINNWVRRRPLDNFPIADTILETVTQRQDLMFNPTNLSEAEMGLDAVFAPDMASRIFIPLVSKGATVGVLVLASQAENVYSDIDHLPVNLIEKLSAHLALAFSNSLMYEKQQLWADTDIRLGVYNHNYFDRQIKIELKKAGQQNYRMGLLMIDMDYLKTVNDTYGHLAGDAALQHLAQIILQSVRSTDVVARYGGDEFGVLLAGCTPRGLAIVSEKIRRTVRTSPVLFGDGLKIPLTVSIGGAIYPDDAGSASDLINKADSALYIAKRRRDQVRLGTKARVVRLKATELSSNEPERELPVDFETPLRQIG